MNVKRDITLLTSFLVLFAIVAPATPAQEDTVDRVKFPDPVGDLFDRYGNPAKGEPYLDIVETELSSSNGCYLAKIKVGGPLPAKTSDPSIFIEWDVLIDSDCNSGTGWNWPLICNDIGPDYLLRLGLIDSQYRGLSLNLKTQTWRSVGYEIDGDTIILRFLPETIATNFNYTVAVRKYGEGGAPQALLVADKAPNKGHYISPDHQTQQEDLDEVARRLNSPALVVSYLEDNFIDIRKPSRYPSVSEVFSNMSGDCDEYAILATYILEKNGYEAYILEVGFNKWWEECNCWLMHDVCVYKENGSYYCIDSILHKSGSNPTGPFNSIEEICSQLPSRCGATDWTQYQLFDTDWNSIKMETKGTSALKS